MRATAVIGAELADGATRYRTLRSDPPLLLRRSPHTLQLVGGAAGPLGGDRLAYRVDVGAGATLTVRSVAASMVLPGTEDSELDVTVEVGEGAHLDWDPQPVISVVASCHRQRTLIRLASTATLRWSEALVLGRSGEAPGSLTSVLRVERSGAVLHHTELRVGPDAPGWDGPAGLAGARAVVTEVSVGPGDHTTARRRAPGRRQRRADACDESGRVLPRRRCLGHRRDRSRLRRCATRPIAGRTQRKLRLDGHDRRAREVGSWVPDRSAPLRRDTGRHGS